MPSSPALRHPVPRSALPACANPLAPRRRARTRRIAWAVPLAALGLLSLGACGNDDPAATAPEPTDRRTSMPTDPTDATSADPTTSAADTAGPARDRLDWVVDQLNDPAPAADRIATGFSPAFLAQVDISEVLAAAGSVAGTDTGWRVDDNTGLERLEGQAVLVSDQGSRIRVTLAVEAAEPHLLVGLLLAPELFPPGQPVTFDVIDTELARQAEVAAYGLFEVTDGRCDLVHGRESDRPVPLGSAFKLWILGALATGVDTGDASWDETFPVDDALKSSPDGEISTLAAGTPVSLERYAELMISISDNSATDHLLARLGRPTVEQAMVEAGVADPARNVPFLSTRELFLLKWGRPERAATYLAMGPGERRRYLDRDLAGVALADEISADFLPPGPTRIDELEWFASATDLCRTQLWLADLAERPGLAPVARILQLNPGLPFDPAWVDVRFKGGSEPGVVYASWRLVHRDGSAYVLTGGLSDPTRALNDMAALTALQAAAGLVP